MHALIPKLSAMASEPTVVTSDMLHRALVAAHRLNLPEWAAWITHFANIDFPSWREI